MKLKITTLLLALSNLAFAQDYNFQPFQLTPLYHNPAFAGSLEKARVNVMTQTKQSAINQHQSHYRASYDQIVDAVKGGIGVAFQYSAEKNWSSLIQAELLYAPKFNIKEKFTISPAIKFTVANRKYERILYFLDQGDPVLDNINYNIAFLDMAAGILGS